MSAGAAEEPGAEGAHHAVDTAAVGPSAPTMYQQKLGARVRSLRERLGLTVDEAAERLVWPPTRVQEIEAGTRRPTAEDLRNLVAHFKLDDRTATDLADLARKASEPGWWADYHDLGVPYIGFEEYASTITAYGIHYLPALLQTSDYARAIITTIAPEIDRNVLQQRIEARLRRQDVLNRESLHYQVLLDESVLQRPVGGLSGMRAQLDKVLTLTRDAKATVRILPLSAGAHAVQDGNFVLLDFPEPEPSPIVFVEGLTASHYLDGKDDVDRYRETIGYLMRSALSREESEQRIIEARNTYASG